MRRCSSDYRSHPEAAAVSRSFFESILDLTENCIHRCRLLPEYRSRCNQAAGNLMPLAKVANHRRQQSSGQKPDDSNQRVHDAGGLTFE
jgi:hypothetical protein